MAQLLVWKTLVRYRPCKNHKSRDPHFVLLKLSLLSCIKYNNVIYMSCFENHCLFKLLYYFMCVATI